MSCLFIDGFDHLGHLATPVSFLKWASTTFIGGRTSTDRFRTGIASWVGTTNDNMVSNVFPASGGAVVGLALNSDSPWSAGQNLLEIREGTTVHMAVALDASGHLTVKNGGGTILATGATVLAFLNWYYLEFKVTIHDTTGSYELKIDGVTELSATSIDTRNGGTGQWNCIRIGGVTSTTSYIDDLYVCDTSGAAPHNTFLGPIKVETIYPQTDAVAAGSNAGLTPSTGTDHGALVDEATPNTSDYNSAATVGLKDTYQYPAMSLTGVILGVQTNLYVQKSDATARQVCAVVRSGGVDYDGANVVPLTTFGYLSTVFALNPNTGTAWSAAAINAMEVGMKVTV